MSREEYESLLAAVRALGTRLGVGEPAPLFGETPKTSPVISRGRGPQEEECLWDANDVRRFMGVSRSWVYSHAAPNGDLPCVRKHGLLRFSPAAVRAYARGEVGGKIIALSRGA